MSPQQPSPRLVQLARRREQLVARSGQLREHLGSQHTPLPRLLAWADRGQAAWHWVLAHPAPVLAGVLGVLLLRPRRALRWAWRGWGLWQWWRKLSHNNPAWLRWF